MITKIWILINFLLYVSIGFLTLFKPESVASTVGYILSAPVAYAELKACYGGLMIVIGVIMLYLLKTDANNGLLFIAIIYLGFGTGRLFGILFNHAFDNTTLIYFTIEAFSTIFSYILYLISH